MTLASHSQPLRWDWPTTCFSPEVARLDQIPVDERLHPEAVIEAIAATGKPAFYEKNADGILRRLVPLL